MSAPVTPHIAVRQMTESDAAAWDRFVFGAKDATFFHRAGWHTIFEEIFRLKPHYFVADRAGEIVGVLPLVPQKSLLFGNALIAARRRGVRIRVLLPDKHLDSATVRIASKPASGPLLAYGV